MLHAGFACLASRSAVGAGIIEAFDIQRYFRRTKAAELAFGDGDFHREIVAQERELS